MNVTKTQARVVYTIQLTDYEYNKLVSYLGAHHDHHDDSIWQESTPEDSLTDWFDSSEDMNEWTSDLFEQLHDLR